jgi:hypothetical protein
MMHMLNTVDPKRSGWSDNTDCMVLPENSSSSSSSRRRAAAAVVVMQYYMNKTHAYT